MVCLGIYAVQLLLGYDNYGLVCLAAQSVTQKFQGDCGKHTGVTHHVTSSTHLPIPLLHIKPRAIDVMRPEDLASQSYNFDTQEPGLNWYFRAYIAHRGLA